MKKLIIGITSEVSCGLIEGQVRFFVENGFDVYLLVNAAKQAEDFCRKEKCTYVPVNIKREISLFCDLRALFQIIVAMRRIKPDIVNVGTPKMGLLGMIAAFVLRVPVRIYTCRGFRFATSTGLIKNILVFMEKVSGACAHKIICISPSLRRKAISEGVFAGQKCVLVNRGSSNGIDLSVFSRSKINPGLQKDMRAKYALDRNFVFGFVGRVSIDKGVRELFEAFSALYEENKNLRLFLVGRLEMETDFAEKIMGHKGVVYAGSVNKTDLPLYYSLFNVFVLPTYREGFGNVLLEAAAMGVPVISTKVTGVVDAVNAGYNGLLVPSKNVIDLRDAMSMLYNDVNLRERYGNNGMEWATNFDQSIIWNGMLSLYKQMIK